MYTDNSYIRTGQIFKRKNLWPPNEKKGWRGVLFEIRPKEEIHDNPGENCVLRWYPNGTVSFEDLLHEFRDTKYVGVINSAWSLLRIFEMMVHQKPVILHFSPKMTLYRNLYFSIMLFCKFKKIKKKIRIFPR